MKNVIFLLITFIFLYITTFAQNEKVVNDIKEKAIAINLNPDSLNFSDLQPLKTILKESRIVGMGEATHGTHEFFAMKHRMLEFLVTEMGYRVFAIEANFTECRAVNDYVLSGKGDAKKAIAGMYFWTWNTQEVLKMVEWMRNYNKGKTYRDQVKFYGFDMQYDIVARAKVISKLKQFDSVYYNSHFKALNNLKIYQKTYTKYTSSQLDSIKKLLASVEFYIADQKQSLLNKFTADEIAYLGRDLRLLEQALMEDEGFNKNWKEGGIARDKCMAENIEWVLEHEGNNSKAMLWAHNGHINKTKGFMGSYLKTTFKEQYYAMGFDFNKGSFRSTDFTTHKLANFTVNEALKGSSGWLFSALTLPSFFIDIEGAVKSGAPAAAYFKSKTLNRSIGAIYSAQHEKNYYLDLSLYDQFDGLIFVNETTAASGINR